MSTQRLLPKMRRGIGRSALTLLAGVLIAWQLALPSIALAAAPIASPVASPTAAASQANPPSDPAQTLAQVSVVRLVATYSGTTEVTCTGLGVVVGSWPSTSSSSQTITTWVLTDASVVNPVKASCATAAKLSSIQVNANNFYTNTPSSPPPSAASPLGSLTCTAATSLCTVTQLNSSPSVCTALTQCTGPVVFSFTGSQPQPFVGVVSATGDRTPHLGIQLTDELNQAPSSQRDVAVQNYLNPSPVSFTGLGSGTQGKNTSNEVGMPILNKEGQLVGMNLSSGPLNVTDLSTFLAARTGPASHTNKFNTAWTQGIADYYAQPPNYQDAQTQFQTAQTANNGFQAATVMAMAAKANAAQNKGPIPSPTSSDIFGIPLWVFGIAGLVVLVGLFLLASLKFGRRRAQQRQELARFKADELAAQRWAEMGVQRQQQALQTPKRDGPPIASVPQQTSYYAWPSPEPKPIQNAETPASSVFQQQQSLPVQQTFSVVNEFKATTPNPQIGSDLRCPNCDQLVPANATYCPNCRYPLAQSLRSPLSASSVMEMSMSNQAPNPSIVLQPSQEIVTEPIQGDLAVRETLRRLWDREGR